MDDIDAVGVANEVRDRLAAALDDMTAETVTLSRHEAIIALGLIEALIEAMHTSRAH